VYIWLFVDAKATWAEPTVRHPSMAPASLAAMRDVSRLGTAMAAMIAMMATTISNSTNEKPCSFFILSSPLRLDGWIFTALLVSNSGASSRESGRGGFQNGKSSVRL